MLFYMEDLRKISIAAIRGKSERERENIWYKSQKYIQQSEV